MANLSSTEGCTIFAEDFLEMKRLAFICREQRIPTTEELLQETQIDTKKEMFQLNALGDFGAEINGSLWEAFTHYRESRSSSAFFKQQNIEWSELAGHSARYWKSNHAITQREMAKRCPPYQELSKSKREIRLLEVSWSNSADFDLTIIPVSLDDDPQYLAISYTCLDSTIIGHFRSSQKLAGDATIGYNQCIMQIIKTIGRPGDTLYLWIDAVSINPHDAKEKSDQIAIMGDIYRQARQVIIFLGDPDDHSTMAMDLLHRVSSIMKMTKLRGRISTADELFEGSIANGIDPAAWYSVLQLFYRRWFTRYWVIPELALGKSPVLICGQHAVSWEKLAETSTWMISHSSILTMLYHEYLLLEPLSVHQSAVGNIHILNQVRLQSERQRLPLQELLMMFGDFHVADPRDRMYALLGLAKSSDALIEILVPDYTLSVEDTYARYARHLLNNDPEMRILERSGIGFKRSLELPSWVPDWTITPRAKTCYSLSQTGNYHATPGSKPVIHEDSNASILLTLDGVVFDTIQALSSVRIRLSDTTIEGYVKATVQWVDEVLSMIQSSTCVENPANDNELAAQKEALWKTLVANASPVRGSNIDAEATERGYDNWLKERRWFVENNFTGSFYLENDLLKEASFFETASSYATKDRRFFISGNGGFGIAPPNTQVDDSVCVFLGARTPFVIRESAKQGSGNSEQEYQLVGEAYHHDIISNPLDLSQPRKICLI